MSLQSESFAAWAVEINPAQLGASLAAYLKVQPSILALRASKRFGGRAAIAKLPLELIEMIESYLLQSEVEARLEAWQQWAKAGVFADGPTDLASWVTYYPDEILDDLRSGDWYKGCEHCIPYQDDCASCTSLKTFVDGPHLCHWEYQDALYDHAEGDLDAVTDEFLLEQREWRDRVRKDTLYEPKCRDMLQACFGLRIRLALSELPPDQSTPEGTELTQAYLISCDAQSHDVPKVMVEDKANKQLCAEVKQGLPLTISQDIPEKRQKQFARAIRTLCLTPINGPSSYGMYITTHGPDLRPQPATSWPQLMMFAGSR